MMMLLLASFRSLFFVLVALNIRMHIAHLFDTSTKDRSRTLFIAFGAMSNTHKYTQNKIDRIIYLQFEIIFYDSVHISLVAKRSHNNIDSPCIDERSKRKDSSEWNLNRERGMKLHVNHYRTTLGARYADASDSVRGTIMQWICKFDIIYSAHVPCVRHVDWVILETARQVKGFKRMPVVKNHFACHFI